MNEGLRAEDAGRNEGLPSKRSASRLGHPLVVFGILGLTVLVADFSFLLLDAHPPLLNDDWALYADLVWDRSRDAGTKIREIFLMSWEGRPLRAIEYGLQWSAHELLGLKGGFLIQALILVAQAFLFARIVATRLGPRFGLLAGLLFALHPADSTHIWLATMMAKLGLLYTLIAVRCFTSGRHLTVYALLVLAFASYELAPFAFGIALWAGRGSFVNDLKRAASLFLLALASYGIWRYFVFAEVAPDLRGLGNQDLPLTELARKWAQGLISVLPVMLVESFTRARTALLCGALVLVPSFLVLLRRERERGDEADDRTTNPRDLRRGLALGLLATLLGAAISFAAAPGFEVGKASRHTIAALPGAALTLTSLFGLMLGTVRGSALGRAGVKGAVLALLAVAFATRLLVQDDYREASTRQREAIRRMATDLGEIPEHSLIVLTGSRELWPEERLRPADERTVEVFVRGHPHEIEAILSLLYDPTIVGIVLDDDEDLARSQVATARQVFAEKATEAFHGIVSYDFRTSEVTWHRRARSEDSYARVTASGPARAYFGM